VHFGLVMDCDHRQDTTQGQAFQDAFELADVGEDVGLDEVWLAERHFASHNSGTTTPSVVSAPLILASAIAARTKRLRVGIAVNVLPLSHPIRIAEEAATVDHISEGRFDFGVGRSGFAATYEGYGIPYGESRQRFKECLDVIVKAWSEERFSYKGEYYSFNDVCVVPKPYQKPYPPIRIAATTMETFPMVGGMGYPIFVGLQGMDLPQVGFHVKVYREAWRQAGHPGEGDVILRIPIYLAETADKAHSEPQESTMRFYRRLAETFAKSAGQAGTTGAEERAERARRLAGVTYDDLLQDRLAYGTPEAVVDKIGPICEELEVSGIIAEMNVGGGLPQEKILNSLSLFVEKVAPEFK